MASNLDSSLRVSLHASEDLRRSLNSSPSLNRSTRRSSTRLTESQGLHGSRSSGVSLWSSTISNNTWPRSASISSNSWPSTRLRSSHYSPTASCLLHAHGNGSDICPFDGSKYRLKPLSISRSPRSFLAFSPASSVRGRPDKLEGRSFSEAMDVTRYGHWEELHSRADRVTLEGDGLNEVMAELEEVFHGSTCKAGLYTKSAQSQTNRFSGSFEYDLQKTQLDSDLLYLNYNDNVDDNCWAAEESFLDKTSSCRINPNAISCSYGNLSLSSKKFPSRVSLQSSGSQETETSGATDNPQALTNGKKLRMQIEAKYGQYRESYLATSPEQELQTLNTGIVNIRKWLRKRHTYLTSLSRSDSNKLTDNADCLKTLIAEAKKQQEGVDVLLDRGQRFLSVRANIVLEVDLENLVYLWNSYVENLRKLQVKTVDEQYKSPKVVETSNSEKVVSSDSNSYRAEDTRKEESSIELKDKDSNSSGSSSSIDVSNDISFHDAGKLTIEDLKTSTALDISELIQEKPIGLVAAVFKTCEVNTKTKEGICQQAQHDNTKDGDNGSPLVEEITSNLITKDYHLETASPNQSDSDKMEVEEHEGCPNVIDANKKKSGSIVDMENLSRMSSSGDGPSSPTSPEKECIGYNELSSGFTEHEMEASATFESLAVRGVDQMLKSESLTSFEMKRRRGLLEAPVNNISNQSSRSESPLSLDSSRSETPTGTLKRAERQNELWRAIGSIDTFLMDKDIIEACKSTAGDLTSEEDACSTTPNVSFAEFLQQYSELTDWLNQVHKVTQREVTSLSEKYLNQSYQEEMLERSPRREFLNNYSIQLLRRYPSLDEQVGARMNRLNAQWAALEKTFAPLQGAQHADTMLRDLESDLSTLRRWLNTIEARLLPLTIKADWTDAELEQKLHQHKAVQRDIESHNKIVNAVLKLSEQLAAQDSEASATGRKSLKVVKEERERDSLQLVAINLQRRWHGIWLHSLEWQCRLEDALTRRKGLYQDGLDFSGYRLPVLDESLFGESSHNVSDQGLIELDDDSLLFVGHRTDFAELDETRSLSASPSLLQEELALWTPDVSDAEGTDASYSADVDQVACDGPGSGATTPVGPSSPPRPILCGRAIAESPLGKRPYPDQTPGDASPAKRGSQSPLSSSGGASPVSLENPLDNFINSRGLCINRQQFDHGLLTPQGLKSSRLLFDRSSGDSANISECESKMGDSPPTSLNPGSPPDALAGGGHESPQNLHGVAKLEVKDVGYSSESQSNDEIEMMRHQIDMEYKFPGKCEVAKDGPLGDKVMFPPVGVRPDYYYMTHVDVDSTTTSDVTDSSGERGGPEPVLEESKEKNDDGSRTSGSLKDSWGKEAFGKENFREKPLKSEACVSDRHDSDATEERMVPMHQLADFSESDSAPEGGKKSIRYLIDHAEDLVKPVSPKSPASSSPKKSSVGQSSIVLQSPPLAPSKQTQTDTCSTVESSCDASGEDNSDHDQAMIKSQMPGEEFSTATDDADDTLFNSVINMESVSTPDPGKTQTFNGFVYPRLSNVYDSARLRKQTGDMSPHQRHRRDKKDRPWSVVGLQEVTCKADPFFPEPIAASESAINKLHFYTDSDSSSSKLPFLLPSQSSTFPRDHRSSQRPHHSPANHNMSSSRSRRRHKHSDSLSMTKELSITSEGSLSTSIIGDKAISTEASSGGEQLQYSPHKTRRPRRPRCKPQLEAKEPARLRGPAGYRSTSATESYDSAEADTESETADEYLTAPMEVPTSEGDDVHNVSGSLSENSTWDNYQMVYPTASEDANEELLAWEPHDDDLEFDDDFQLARQRSRSIVTDVLADGQQRRKLKFTKQGVPCDDSDSDLEDFHHILDQSELQLKLVDQSLRKKRRDPMGTGLHPKPGKYSEIIETIETNIRCLKSICQHLNSEDVTEDDVKRVKDLMYQWEKVCVLASERHSQTTALSDIRDKVAAMKANLEETGEMLSFDKFSSAEGLYDAITRLKEKRESLERQNQQVEELRQQLTEFFRLHPTICVDKYLSELTSVQNANSVMLYKVKEHVSSLESQQNLWLEYLDGQQELDKLLTADRDRLHQLLWHRESGLTLTKKDVLTELETLQSSLSLYESKLAVLGAMRARLTQSSDKEAQQVLLASLADLRNQLLVVSQRCRQMYRDVEDDQILPLQPLDGLDGLDKDSELGKLAVSAAALHEVFSQTRSDSSVSGTPAEEGATKSPSSNSKTGLSRSCAVALCSLPVQVVALVLVAGLAYALDPDILDKMASFTLTVTPELNYVNGPPAI